MPSFCLLILMYRCLYDKDVVTMSSRIKQRKNGIEAFDVAIGAFDVESQLAVDAVLRPLEADVVTMRTKQGMERWLYKCAIAI